MNIEILNLREGSISGTYIINGFIEVDNTHIYWEDVITWVNSGNEVMPKLTNEDIAIQELNKKFSEAKEFLKNTDYKMTVDYYNALTQTKRDDLISQRETAREFVRANQSCSDVLYSHVQIDTK